MYTFVYEYDLLYGENEIMESNIESNTESNTESNIGSNIESSTESNIEKNIENNIENNIEPGEEPEGKKPFFIKEEGISLRQTFAVMLIVSLVITALLLATTFFTLRDYYKLSGATDDYIVLNEAASGLLQASDFLTEEVQSYTVTGERVHLDHYFVEANTSRNREKAIYTMEEMMPDSEALAALREAMKESVALMDREFYSMRLVLEATGDTDIPDELADVVLTPEDEALSDDEKMELARKMVHDNIYYERKERIRSHMSLCIDNLKKEVHYKQSRIENNVFIALIVMAVLIVFQSLSLILMLRLTTRLGINPLLQAVEHIKRDQKIPITGAYEFRYLASTYNKMYTAYQKSIDNLSYKASHDELTNLYNRAGYDLVIESIESESTAFLLIDADKFKDINDTYGHETGDKVLCKVARVLRKQFRSDDYVFRIGGDEFVVLMVHVNPELTELVINKVDCINRDLANEEDGLPGISVSVGISMCSKGLTPHELYCEADAALYEVKRNGRNGCRIYKNGLGGRG